MDPYTRELLIDLLDYVRSDEMDDYSECSGAERENHIFLKITMLDDWLKRTDTSELHSGEDY